MGLMSLLGQGATSFAPALLGGLFHQHDPQEQFRRQMMQLLSPQNQQAQTSTLYNQYLNSPAYSGALTNAANTGNLLQNRLNASLGMRGLSGSGIGAIAPAVAQGVAGNLGSQVRIGGYNQAANDAANLIQQQARMQQSIGPGTNYTNQFMGAGLSAFSPILMNYLQGLGGGRQGLPNQSLQDLQGSAGNNGWMPQQQPRWQPNPNLKIG